ncbi:uncharacterized protein LOC110733730 [Chenopodium quinoa]|uniref:uncharacterized protein LOC110733730 n=1 Tax=Chenopodium quinoa TaxID=63459 RepID=UPI000B781DFC|nr:uncharacterized protein LOC110733730 [Chenopodium quinoa]
MKNYSTINARSAERKRQHRKQVEKDNNSEPRKQVEKENKSYDFTLQLDSKQRSLREKTLTSLVHFLSSNARHEFIDKNYVTLIHRCLHRLTFKKIGSSKFSKTEIRLAVRIISLVVINLVNEDKSSDIFHQCVPKLANALVSLEYEGDVVLELIACLGMVGFFGSRSSMEVEKVMRVVWDFGHKSNSPGSVLASTISTWLFFITVVNADYLSNKHCKECVSYLSSLLKREDFEDNDCESVYTAVTDALTLMFDNDMLNKFSYKLETEEECVLLKEKIGGNFEGSLDDFREIIQVRTMKEFLGKGGFASHLKTNENFYEWYESTTCDEANDDDNDNEDIPEREEVVLKFYRPEVERQKEDNDLLLPYVSAAEKNVQKRMIKSPCSPLNKARTRLLTKQRKFVNYPPVEGDLWV